MLLGKQDWTDITLEDYLQMFRGSGLGAVPPKIPLLQFLGGKDGKCNFRLATLYDAIGKNYNNNMTSILQEECHHMRVSSGLDLMERAVRSGIFLNGLRTQL